MYSSGFIGQVVVNRNVQLRPKQVGCAIMYSSHFGKLECDLAYSSGLCELKCVIMYSLGFYKLECALMCSSGLSV